MKLFSRHPDDSTGSVRGGVLQAPSTYVKMRIAVCLPLVTGARYTANSEPRWHRLRRLGGADNF